jgi:hypothetical protein
VTIRKDAVFAILYVILVIIRCAAPGTVRHCVYTIDEATAAGGFAFGIIWAWGIAIFALMCAFILFTYTPCMFDVCVADLSVYPFAILSAFGN